jgi:hypothetical protein
MSAFTKDDPKVADVLARLDLARRGMVQTLLTGKPYKSAASHLAPLKPLQPATVTQIRKRSK